MRRQSGVTLIELLVGITLIAIVMAMAAPSIGTAIRNREIRTAAESILNGLQAAKAEALRRNRPVAFTLGTGSGWQVGCNPADDTIPTAETEAVCPSLIQRRDAQEGSSGAQVATSELVASTNAAASTPAFTGGAIRFTSLGRVDTTPTTGSLLNGNLARYLVSNPLGGSCAADGGEMRCLAVHVTWTGQVRMCDPAVAAGDPRAC